MATSCPSLSSSAAVGWCLFTSTLWPLNFIACLKNWVEMMNITQPLNIHTEDFCSFFLWFIFPQWWKMFGRSKWKWSVKISFSFCKLFFIFYMMWFSHEKGLGANSRPKWLLCRDNIKLVNRDNNCSEKKNIFIKQDDMEILQYLQ